MSIELRDLEVAGLFRLPHLKIEANEKVLIYGPSGRGKTSLLHLLGGLWKPASGKILIAGSDIVELSENELSQLRRKKIGYIFQKMNLIEHMTARENLELVESEADAAKKHSLLERVGLGAKANQLAGTLSLGEQQRLAIARVVLQSPDIILADEPTSSLDEANSKKVLDLLFEVAQRKILIVISHDTRLQKHFDRNLNFEELIR